MDATHQPTSGGMSPMTSVKTHPQRPNPISLRAQSNVETKAAARKGLLTIMMNKFSSTPLSLHESHEFQNLPDGENKELLNMIRQKKNEHPNTKRHELDMYQYDASLTKSERDYIRHIILSGDTNSIQSASVVLQNEDVFPVQQQLVVSKSSTSNTTNTSKSSNNNHCDMIDGDDSCGDLSVIANDEEEDEEDDVDDATATTAADDCYRDEKKEDMMNDHPLTTNLRVINPASKDDSAAATTPSSQVLPSVRDSMIQQQLFRLHEANKDLQPNELIQRMSRQNSILTMDDSTTTTTTAATNNNSTTLASFRHYRSMSPPPISEGEVMLSTARSYELDNDAMRKSLVMSDNSNHNDSKHSSVPMTVECETSTSVHPNTGITDDCDDTTAILQPQVSPSLTEVVHKVDAMVLNSSWNPFDDISSWLDGSQGVEVTATTPSQTTVQHSRANPLPNGDVVPSIQSHPLTTNIDDAITTATNVTSSQQPFRILGTSADDVSCHPHVLSPPLMESLLAFVPEYQSTHHHLFSTDTCSRFGTSSTYTEQPTVELSNAPESTNVMVDGTNETLSETTKTVSLDCRQFTCQNDATTSKSDPTTKPTETANSIQQQQQFIASSLMHTSLPSLSSPSNFWLKYSLVRDGPGLWTFLRQVRASAVCILAIETTEGHVMGAYTSQPWRLSKGWYGNKDTFLWKMRRSRLETAGKSILQQIHQESEIQVYPYRTGNVAVQYCSNKCLMLGQGEVIPSPKKHNPERPPPSNVGKHYGYALYLDKDLKSGTTSSSETFGNPCLLDGTQRGARFNVANIEVWTLTPHTTVAEAEQSELSNLFLDGGRDSAHRLNFMNILVGGPI